MRTKLLGLFLVGVLLIVAVPSFASADEPAEIESQPLNWWELVNISLFNGACVYENGGSAAPVNLAISGIVAGTQVTVPAFGLSSTPAVGVLEFMATPPVPNGGTFDVLVNGYLAFSVMQVINCAPTSAPPVAQDRPGDSFVCAVPMPPGYGYPQYAQRVEGEELLSWNGYVAVVEGDLQLFAHPGADQVGPWRVTADDWEDTFDIQLVGPNVCQVVQ